MVMVWVAVVALPQASVTVYVLVNVIGHVPEADPSLLVTVRPPSPQASVIVNPFERGMPELVLVILNHLYRILRLR